MGVRFSAASAACKHSRDGPITAAAALGGMAFNVKVQLHALDLLFQQEVIPIDEYNRRRGHFKKHVKRFYDACRRFDEGLRARMNAFEAAAAHRRPKAIKRSTEGVGPTVAAGVAPASKSASSSEEREANASEAKEAMSAV